MLFSKFLLASLLGAASAFIIPEGSEEGVYEYHLDPNGNDVFVKLANATDYSTKKPGPYAPKTFAGRFKRQGDVPHCMGMQELNHADTDAANADLDWQCDHYEPTRPSLAFYSIKGDVVAFFCNFDNMAAHKCSSYSRGYSSSLITQNCGPYRPGYTSYAPHGTSYGYTPNYRICS